MVAPASSLSASPPRAAPASAGAVRVLGSYQLLRLLGKSAQSMLWLVQDTRNATELMLAMPRTQPTDEAALDEWLQRMRRAARLSHPNLAQPVDIGQHERWPYVTYERGAFATWNERIPAQGLPALEASQWSVQALRALAFAHEAGLAHRDLQPFSLLADEAGTVKLLGLEVVDFMPAAQAGGSAEEAVGGPGGATATEQRRQQRDGAEYDVLGFGIVLHQVLSGEAALQEVDVARAIARMPPRGRDIVRLPWAVPRPIPEALRAIVNRATDRQARQRYRSARTFQRALEGWLQANAEQDAGPIALLLDRLRSVGLLPSMPGSAQRAARLALMEGGHTTELSDLVLQDFALAFELLRAVNLAQSQAGHASSGPVLATHRAIAMLGLNGVRQAALSLRHWPGPLNEDAALALEALIRRVKRAGNVARALQPAGYDTEVVYLIAVLQNLGWLAVQYHFPEEALQIRRLMQPQAAQDPAQKDEPGMSAEAASFAVLGIDIEALGAAVIQHWGLDESVQHLVRRLSPSQPVRPPESDDDMLRTVASCANEAVEAMSQPARHSLPALQRVAQRYARALDIDLNDLQEALQPQAAARPDAARVPTLSAVQAPGPVRPARSGEPGR